MFLVASAVVRAVLRPADGVEEAGGSEFVGAEHVFDKDADGAFELVEGVVEGDDGAFDEEGCEEVEIEFCALVGVVAVDPQETDGAVPADGYLARRSAVGFHLMCESGGLDG